MTPETERIPVGDGSEVLVIPAGAPLHRIDLALGGECWSIVARYRSPVDLVPMWRVHKTSGGKGEGRVGPEHDSPQAALDWLAEEFGA